jgi:aspartate aminotransferase
VGITVNHEQILITTGGSEAILFGFFACLNPGDEIIIPEPFYANYNGFAVEAGVKVVPITSHIENGFALPPIDDFEKVMTSRTRAIIICNPNNPTGYLYSRDEMEKLKSICIRPGSHFNPTSSQGNFESSGLPSVTRSFAVMVAG